MVEQFDGPCNRRDFMKAAAALSALSVWPSGCVTLPGMLPRRATRSIEPAVVRGAFFYPPDEVVLAGRNEDGWSRYKWYTWPGNQFAPEEQQAKFEAELRRITADLDLRLAMDDEPLYTNAHVEAFLKRVEAEKPDALLLFNFWNTFSSKLYPILDAYPGPIILYHPVGSNHQLPPERFRTAPRMQYIHAVEQYQALERGLRAVSARTRMEKSRLLRVSGRLEEEVDAVEPRFGTRIHGVPAAVYNRIYDEQETSAELKQVARFVRARARSVTDLSEEAFLGAARAHMAVCDIMERYDADAITIECLMLQHRKPCVSFALHNGIKVPCGCENDLNSTLTQMLGAALFGRGGFQHNPDFDMEENRYFASHCTCLTKLHGPDGKDATYDLRPFFHHLPKTVALDVQWPAGAPTTLFKYHSGAGRLDAWVGDVIESPACPPTGGCATRVLVRMRDVPEVCSVYPGPHPVLYCGDFGRQAATFAELYELELRGNVG